MSKTIKEQIYEAFIQNLADTPLVPTSEEFWGLIKKAREILLENLEE